MRHDKQEFYSSPNEAKTYPKSFMNELNFVEYFTKVYMPDMLNKYRDNKQKQNTTGLFELACKVPEEFKKVLESNKENILNDAKDNALPAGKAYEIYCGLLSLQKPSTELLVVKKAVYERLRHDAINKFIVDSLKRHPEIFLSAITKTTQGIQLNSKSKEYQKYKASAEILLKAANNNQLPGSIAADLSQRILEFVKRGNISKRQLMILKTIKNCNARQNAPALHSNSKQKHAKP